MNFGSGSGWGVGLRFGHGHGRIGLEMGRVPGGVARGLLDTRLERLAEVLDDNVRVAQAVLVLGGKEARHVQVEAHLVLLLLALDQLAAAAGLGHEVLGAECDGAEQEAGDIAWLEGVEARLLNERLPLGIKVLVVDLLLGPGEQLDRRPAQVGDVLA